jgi:hypothetical protein
MPLWLREKELQYAGEIWKLYIYHLIKISKLVHRTYTIDYLLAELDHNILRLSVTSNGT